MAGNALPAGSKPWAAVYAGHQFGVFVPQLGDGRAITLGEVDEAPAAWEWQLKGAGDDRVLAFRRRPRRAALDDPRISVQRSDAPSRDPDDARARDRRERRPGLPRGPRDRGRAVAHRAVTRAVRNVRVLPLPRRPDDDVRMLADDDDRALLRRDSTRTAETKYADFLRAVAVRTARLVAKWQAVGFEHGVMNTDNMSILGLTLDYGPFGFMEPTSRAGSATTATRPAAMPSIASRASRCGTATRSPPRSPRSFRARRLSRARRVRAGLSRGVSRRDARQTRSIGGAPRRRRPHLGAARRARPRRRRLHDVLPRRWRSVRRPATRSGRGSRATASAFAAEASPCTGAARGRCCAVNPGLRAPQPPGASGDRARASPATLARSHDSRKRLRTPYDERPEYERYAEPAPAGTPTVEVSCSS